MKKNNILLYACILIFGLLGIYLTFIASSTNKFDSKTEAYQISPNETSSSDGTVYHPIYYYKVNGIDYECRSSIGSSSYPNEDKKLVYYDSSNPTKCKTEYETKSNRVAGIICLVAAGVIIYFFIIKKPVLASDDIKERTYSPEYNEEQAQRVIGIVNKAQLIYKRVILAIIVVILLVFILLDTMLFKQTIKAKNYIDAVAKYVDVKEEQVSEISVDYIYSFEDKNGQIQEITVSESNDVSPSNEIKIKYNANNPQEYYEEAALLDKSGITWYIVKIVALILLIVLFFNKKLLSKIGLSLTSK